MEGAVKTFVMESGERYCLLIDKNNGLPLFYPNLFLTTQVRNRSLSYSSIHYRTLLKTGVAQYQKVIT